MSLRLFLVILATCCALPAWGQIRYTVKDLGQSTSANPLTVLESTRAITNAAQVAAAQTITFPGIARQVYGASPLLLEASASSSLPVSYRLVSGPARVSGGMVTILGAGTVTIEATQAGNAHYLPAKAQDRTFTVVPAAQTISFPALPQQVIRATPLSLKAVATSGLPVTFTVISGPGTITGKALSLTGVGAVTVKATQAGNANFYPAPAVAESILVVKAAQTIKFAAIADTTYGAAPLTLKASASSGLPVTLTVLSGPGLLSGTNLQIISAGTLSVQASQPGDATRSAAESVTQTFTVVPIAQKITFPALPDLTAAAAPFDLTATASSGLPVAYQVTGPATLEGNTLTLTGVGTVTLTAMQPGDVNRLPAPSVSRSFNVLRADVWLPSLFGHHMVLQQGTSLPVWGEADPGLKINVAIGTRTAQTTADAQGQWRVNLAPLPLSGQPLTLTVKGTNTLTFNDVLVGDVWLASGQSNMAFPLSESLNGAAETAQATDTQIRFFLVPQTAALTPQGDVAGRWQVCSPATAGDFSAVAYFFAQHLRAGQKRPVGLIGAYWKATPAESWTSLEGLSRDSSLSTYVQAYRKIAELNPVPPDLSVYRTTSTLLYNGMIAPLIPYGIKGVIWYQGEANVSQASLYRTLFAAMIADWRGRWGEGNFPFLYTQLSTFDTDVSLMWPNLREAQLQSLAVPNTAMAVTVDIGDPTLLHPLDKSDVGTRLGLAADALVYGKSVVYSGPVYRSATVAGSQIRIAFTSTGSGLAIGLSPFTPPSQAPLPTDHLVGFSIAGTNQIWQPATAVISGNQLNVSSPLVPNPVAVRYEWANAPRGNLYNVEGLPASPFRTDTW